MGHGDALELMKAAHKRSQDNMDKHKACTPEGHASLVDAAIQSQSDSEIIYFALQQIPQQTLDKLNGQKEEFRKPQDTISGKDTTKVEFGKFKLSTNNVEVATAFMRVLSIAAVIGMFIYGVNFLNKMNATLHERMQNVEKAVTHE